MKMYIKIIFMSLNEILFIYFRYNYKVGDVFRELMGVTGMNGCAGNNVEFAQSTSRKSSKCNIL